MHEHFNPSYTGFGGACIYMIAKIGGIKTVTCCATDSNDICAPSIDKICTKLEYKKELVKTCPCHSSDKTKSFIESLK